MTVSTTTSRVEYAGNGSTTAFAVNFYFLANADLKVYKAGVLQTITTHYSVSGAGNPAGGTVTFVSAPAAGQAVVILRDPALTQTTDYVANDPFPAESHERALDRLTMIAQRNRELGDRSFRLADGDTSGASTLIPTPEANKFVAWNPTGTGLQNVDPTTLVTSVTYGTTVSNIFTGDSATTAFTLSANPGSVNNLDVSIGGVTQLPGIDYTWTGGTTLTFTPAPANGEKILVRFGQALPQAPSALNIQVANFTGTGAQVNFTLPSVPTNENHTGVYVGGVYQQKNTYSLAGTTLTFSEAPPVNASIEVTFI